MELITWDTAQHTFTRYCKECHGETTPDADLDLTTIDHKSDLAANPEKWTTILQALRTHYMPHPDGREMPLEKRLPLIDKVRNELVQQAADHDSESSSFRRLNRAEFNNTLNDLLFVNEKLFSASLGQVVDLLFRRLLDPDQPLVLQLLQDRVHRPGAGPIHASGALFQALHQLVAVRRVVLQ